MPRAALLLACLLTMLVSGSARAQVYILTFDRWGELENPGERDLAVRELAENKKLSRIIVFAYGWAYDGEKSYSSYRDTLAKMREHMPARDRAEVGESAVIAVGWDSSLSGFRKLANDILPFPGIADTLAWLPDNALFPLSFWSKAAQADRIGFGGLRTALNQIFSVLEGRDPYPDLYLVGHSFGTRIVSGLMKDQIGRVRVGKEPFLAAEHVDAAVLLQPALVPGNLHLDADYPILVSMSRHDHALGFLYPIANLPMNSAGFSIFEALINRWLLDPMSSTLGTVGSVVTAPLPGRKRVATPDEPEPWWSSQTRSTIRTGRRTLGELLAVPFTMVFTLVVTPIDYAYIQTRALASHPLDHVMDTLAQIPLVEAPVHGLDRLLGHEIPWGERGKGFLTLGPLHDPVGRHPVPRMADPRPLDIYSPEQLLALSPLPNGPLVVDSSSIIRRGIFGTNLQRPSVDFTLGWLDLIGAHGDYTNRDVVRLLGHVVETTRDNP